MKSSFVIPKVSAPVPVLSTYTPLYDIDTINFKTKDRERIFINKAHDKFHKYFEDNKISVDKYISSSKNVGPFNVWENVYKYKIGDMALHNVMGYSITGLQEYDLTFNFESFVDAKMFYDLLVANLQKCNKGAEVNDTLRLHGATVSKSTTGKICGTALITWCNTLKEFVTQNKTSISVDLMVLPQSQWWSKNPKKDWIVCDNDGTPYILSNCEYVLK